jgi:hypothetical protein
MNMGIFSDRGHIPPLFSDVTKIISFSHGLVGENRTSNQLKVRHHKIIFLNNLKGSKTDPSPFEIDKEW